LEILNLRVTLAQLEAFYWTAQLGSAQRAAAHLHLAQPTISLRLKDLARATGAELLERTARGLRPTPEGRAMLARIAVILDEVHGLAGETAPAERVGGAIRIGLADGFAVTCLPPLLAALREEHPLLIPEWVVSTGYLLEEALQRDTLDLAVMLNPIGHEQIRMMALGAQPTAWVAPASWNLAGPVTPADLAPLPIITNPPPSAMHRQIADWFAHASLAPERLSICTSTPVIGELVAGGIGAALLPLRMAERYVAQGAATVLAARPLPENGKLFIGWRSGIASPNIRAVARLIGRVVQAIGYLD
jgi:DNA-binding transcriptional LysR family regulator